jgi:hypothetical protein
MIEDNNDTFALLIKTPIADSNLGFILSENKSKTGKCFCK